MEFKLTITLGNDAMQIGCDVADALELVAESLDDFCFDLTSPIAPHVIRDDNGANVGTWEVA